jgi:hypothetical protein
VFLPSLFFCSSVRSFFFLSYLNANEVECRAKRGEERFDDKDGLEGKE